MPGWSDFGVREAVVAVVSLLWWMEFIIFRRKTDRKKGEPDTGRHSFRLIMGAILLALFISIGFYLMDLAQWKGNFANLVKSIGAGIYLLGIVIRYWSLIVLGQHFTRNISVGREQTLISTGPYHLLRHPAYTGLLFLNIGLHLYIGNLIGIVAAIIFVTVALHVRIVEEEIAMEKVMGARYRTWSERRKRLFPWLY